MQIFRFLLVTLMIISTGLYYEHIIMRTHGTSLDLNLLRFIWKPVRIALNLHKSYSRRFFIFPIEV